MFMNFRSPYFMILVEQIDLLYLVILGHLLGSSFSYIGVTITEGTGFWTPENYRT